MGGDGAVLYPSLMLPPKGTLPAFPTVLKEKAWWEWQLGYKRESLEGNKEIGQGKGQLSVFVAFYLPSSSLLSSRF